MTNLGKVENLVLEMFEGKPRLDSMENFGHMVVWETILLMI